MEITLKVENEHIINILESAAIKYWCKDIKFYEESDRPWKDVIEHPHYPKMWLLDIDGVWHGVNRTKIKHAIQLIRDKCPWNLGAILGDSGGDAITGDCILQYACYGKVVHC